MAAHDLHAPLIMHIEIPYAVVYETQNISIKYKRAYLIIKYNMYGA